VKYVVYDLEFNQKDNSPVEGNIDSEKTKHKVSSNMPFEIIQVGALKLDKNFETLSTFNRLVKPTLYKSIHPFIENLTKITNDMVDSCEGFISVYEDFLDFIGDDEIILCVWGLADVKELIRNIKFYDLPATYISKYIDVQKYASKFLKYPKSSRIGLKNAIELLGIPFEGEFHDAYNDAHYTAEIFKLIYSHRRIKPSVYTPPTRISQPKEKIDMVSLINQFEKMFGREMSEEEKSIIKLAYTMGKTRQFIMKDTKQDKKDQ
jgi:inhibitor of KinA sporulation pathway (predicted exonuclease)